MYNGDTGFSPHERRHTALHASTPRIRFAVRAEPYSIRWRRDPQAQMERNLINVINFLGNGRAGVRHTPRGPRRTISGLPAAPAPLHPPRHFAYGITLAPGTSPRSPQGRWSGSLRGQIPPHRPRNPRPRTNRNPKPVTHSNADLENEGIGNGNGLLDDRQPRILLNDVQAVE